MTAAVGQPWTVLSCALAALLLSVGLVRGERLAFNFFPSPEATILNAEVKFVAGTSPARVERFVTHLTQALRETEAHFGEPLVEVAVARLGEIARDDGQIGSRGDQFRGPHGGTRRARPAQHPQRRVHRRLARAHRAAPRPRIAVAGRATRGTRRDGTST